MQPYETEQGQNQRRERQHHQNITAKLTFRAGFPFFTFPQPIVDCRPCHRSKWIEWCLQGSCRKRYTIKTPFIWCSSLFIGVLAMLGDGVWVLGKGMFGTGFIAWTLFISLFLPSELHSSVKIQHVKRIRWTSWECQSSNTTALWMFVLFFFLDEAATVLQQYETVLEFKYTLSCVVNICIRPENAVVVVVLSASAVCLSLIWLGIRNIHRRNTHLPPPVADYYRPVYVCVCFLAFTPQSAASAWV